MQIRIITLEETSPLVNEMQALFPEADVGIQRGIDVRKSPTELLFSSDLISHSVVHTLQHRRRWDHEVPSKGAIGLAHANRLALEEDLTQPLLLLEADCKVLDGRKLRREVHHLIHNAEKFDIAVFGALYKGSKPPDDVVWLPRGFKLMKDKFWLMHSVLYTPMGRKRVSSVLHRPLEMQIDSLYGSEAQMGKLIVVGQLHGWSTTQHNHSSSIQEEPCRLLRRMVGIPVAVFALVLYRMWRKHRVVDTLSVR